MIDIGGLFKKASEKVIGTVVDSIGKAGDRLFTNDEERMKAQAPLDQIKLEAAKEINRAFEAIQADATHQIEMHLQNTANARARETEFVKATGHIDWMQTIVGLTVLVALIGCIFVVAFRKIPEGPAEHLMINALGILEGMAGLVVGYYYGSSAGSRIKDMKKPG